jgi:hypothetical protein
VLARVLDPAAYQTAARVGTAAGAAYDTDAAFAFGLARVLDGLEALVEARGGAQRAGGRADSAT